MKLGYGTYGMKELDIFEVLPRLKAIGYDAVELTVMPGWSADPDLLDDSARSKLAEQFQLCEFPPPVLLGSVSPCLEGEQHKDALSRFTNICVLAQQLNFADHKPAIVTSTLNGKLPEWKDGKEQIAESLLQYAAIAENFNVVFAVEPHVGGQFDTPDKADWLMQATCHPSLKLNFDISHFAVQGMDTMECVKLCAPYAVHCHVKDGRMDNGKVRFLLPGQGEFDYAEYFKALQQAGVQLPVTVEVSAMVWKEAGYDPWAAAQFSYDALNNARNQM